MKQIKFRLTAYTDPAGKRNDELPYKGNEDNFYVDADLSNDVQGEFSSDKVQVLSKQGCLLTVADGMGGANAGEVASKIAIDTVKEFFGKEKIKAQKFETAKQRAAYMEKLVVQASRNICKKAAADSACEGMGSTIIMGWLSGNELTVTWCGDSRAYVLRDGVLCQVSNDHSYVQQLVDEHKITRDEAFDHPYGNIITRSLGDPDKDAKADSITMKVYKGDIILVCSDGLSGVLRDSTIQDIINGNRDSMVACREALWEAAEKADWYDNVTAILCEVTEGEKLPAAEAAKWKEKAAEQNGVILEIDDTKESGFRVPLEKNGYIRIKKKTLIWIFCGILALVLGWLAYQFYPEIKDKIGNDVTATESMEDGDLSLTTETNLKKCVIIDTGEQKEDIECKPESEPYQSVEKDSRDAEELDFEDKENASGCCLSSGEDVECQEFDAKENTGESEFVRPIDSLIRQWQDSTKLTPAG